MTLEVFKAGSALAGVLTAPGDKSISHRALIFSALARGRSGITGLLESADVLATQQALQQMGATFKRTDDLLVVTGIGGAGLQPPQAPLDMGNSGTAMRLLAGVLAAQSFDSVLTGDESLNTRPMQRIIKPLLAMGADIKATAAGTAPLHISGRKLHGIHWPSSVASAQVKSCVLLCGLFADGETSVSEPLLSRDHTERMLPLFGVPMPKPLTVRGPVSLQAADISVPGDISSAAFMLAAALMVPGSDVRVRGVGLNPSRDGFVRALKAMGADLTVSAPELICGEPVANLRARAGKRLRGIDLPPAWLPSMIDEIPVLAVLAAGAKGMTRIRGARELRVKESDRLEVMGSALKQLGVPVRMYDDGMDIEGVSELGSASLDSAGDHRCAMSLAVLALRAPDGLRIRNSHNIVTSYPTFVRDLAVLGARSSGGPSA